MLKNKNSQSTQSGFAHLLLVVIVVVIVGVIGFAGYKVTHKNRNTEAGANYTPNNQHSGGGTNLGDPDSTDPVTKGMALANGECSGKGTTALTHAPMDPKDLEAIHPYGLMVGGHVTPVDHQYYWGKGENNSAKDAYPVYADAAGTIVNVGEENSTKWSVIISHNSCTFFSWYNLMTSLDKSIQAQLPAKWGQNSQVAKIPVKAGQLLGYVGGQSLDFAVWNTEKNLPNLLFRTAYNNREPWKVNTVPPLDYFSKEVKAQIIPKYTRAADPIDGRPDYDQSGKAVGTWFLKGSNGYAGGTDAGKASTNYFGGHLALAYYYVDPGALVFSTGDYQGQPTQFAVVGNSPDWKDVSQSSGVIKYQLATPNPVNAAGSTWMGEFDQHVKLKASSPQATLLIQLTGKDEMKVEVFPGKTPDQVNGFDGNAKTYNRGQDAQMLKSNTAT